MKCKYQTLVHLLTISLAVVSLAIATGLLNAPPTNAACEDSGCGSRDFGNAVQRPSISGTYRGVNVWGVLRITGLNYRANPLTFLADDNNENPYFRHATTGNLVSIRPNELVWNITTRRTDISSGCTTAMSGTLIQKNNKTAKAIYTGTDGRCDLPINFSSVIDFRKN